MDLSTAPTRPERTTGACPACGVPLPAAPRERSPVQLARAARSYRGAWFVLGCVFVSGLLWANRFEYQACDVDGCVRIDRWSSSVDWIGSSEPPAPDLPHSLQARTSPAGAGPARAARPRRSPMPSADRLHVLAESGR